MDERKFADEARQRRQPRDHQRAGDEGQPQKRCRSRNDLADHFLFIVVQRRRGAVHQVGREEGGIVLALIGRHAEAVIAPALNQVGEQEQRTHGHGGAQQVVQQAPGELVVAHAHGRQQRAR